MRILVVEDDQKVASFIQKGLGEEGMAVDVLNDGDDAAVSEWLTRIEAKYREMPGLQLTERELVYPAWLEIYDTPRLNLRARGCPC